MPKHTSGPWEHDHCYIYGPGPDGPNKKVIAEMWERRMCDRTAEDAANLPMLAAAPELYEALAMMLEDGDDPGHRQAAISAIAKAEGREQIARGGQMMPDTTRPTDEQLREAAQKLAIYLNKIVDVVKNFISRLAQALRPTIRRLAKAANVLLAQRSRYMNRRAGRNVAILGLGATLYADTRPS